MNVSLTPKLEAFVRRKVADGLYGSASEVVREALRRQMEAEVAAPETPDPADLIGRLPLDGPGLIHMLDEPWVELLAVQRV
ncbi:MAG: type II toxin-antitoxin system ParD family antitoxin, partial [Trueperaceae bacterium]